MNIQTMKLEVVQKILGLNTESLLTKISSMLDQELIVGYTADGKPLNKAEYDNRLRVGEQQINNREYTTQDDLEKESATW